ncbi:hypothetical protein CJ030_MR3G009919 [Morella rubra]|uniref:Uncharacterized protein n=1 Tax=Morella rubra TaxID=262757 RepID=A0A6A1W5C1_9ROSI|nr:hypothetical protein CJ030_MR3G009919 [Morella rubra]
MTYGPGEFFSLRTFLREFLFVTILGVTCLLLFLICFVYSLTNQVCSLNCEFIFLSLDNLHSQIWLDQCGFFEWLDPRTCSRGMEVGPHLMKKNKALQSELDMQKQTVKVLKVMLGASWVALVVMGVLLFSTPK